MNDKKTLDSFKLEDDALDMVNGGCYINASMSLEEIVSTDRHLAGFLNQNGIKVTGNRGMSTITLYEAAEKVGADPYVLESAMNDYLGNI